MMMMCTASREFCVGSLNKNGFSLMRRGDGLPAFHLFATPFYSANCCFSILLLLIMDVLREDSGWRRSSGFDCGQLREAARLNPNLAGEPGLIVSQRGK